MNDINSSLNALCLYKYKCLYGIYIKRLSNTSQQYTVSRQDGIIFELVGNTDLFPLSLFTYEHTYRTHENTSEYV